MFTVSPSVMFEEILLFWHNDAEIQPKPYIILQKIVSNALILAICRHDRCKVIINSSFGLLQDIVPDWALKLTIQ